VFSAAKAYIDQKNREMEALSKEYLSHEQDDTFMMGYERYNDPLALKISWKPHVPSMKEQSPKKLLFKTPLKVKSRAPLMLALASLIFTATAVYGYNKFFLTFSFEFLWGSTSFLAAGIYMMTLVNYPVTFDQATGEFTAGKKIRRRLSEIHALQILQRVDHHEESSHYKHQLILVFADGSRQFVCEYTKRNPLLDDAGKLAAFLGGIPVWDELA